MKKTGIIFSHFVADGPMYYCEGCGAEVPHERVMYDHNSNEFDYYRWPLYCWRCGAFFIYVKEPPRND